jgi:hypothetical protein
MSSPTHSSLFPRLKINLKGSHFDTIEVMETELQGVLNTLTERNFQDTSKKWQKHWKWCIQMEGIYFESDGG